MHKILSKNEHMKTENLPVVVHLVKDQVCHVCGLTIKKDNYAVHHWRVTDKRKAYDHMGCIYDKEEKR